MVGTVYAHIYSIESQISPLSFFVIKVVANRKYYNSLENVAEDAILGWI